MKKILKFDFNTKETLNSNRMPNSFIVKSKLASNIRNLAAQEGIQGHTDSDLAKARYEIIQQEAHLALLKSRAKKKSKDKSAKEVEELIEEIIKEHSPEVSSNDINVPYLFDHFKLTVVVLPPTRIRTDPPNFYPTVKALVDGLTDSSWWEDDDFTHLVETSFKYGGLSGKKNIYTIILEIEEVESLDDYVIETEFQG